MNVVLALPSPNREAIKFVTESSTLALGVCWETFLSDLVVSYLNNDCSVLTAALEGVLEIKVKDAAAKKDLVRDIAAKAISSGLITLAMPKHLPTDQLLSVLTPDDDNLTFPTNERLKEFVGRFLAPTAKANFDRLTGQHYAFIAALKAIRNYIAHRSDKAKDTMQDSLKAPHLPAYLVRGNHDIVDVGDFLSSRPDPQQKPRIDQMLAEAKAVAGVVCP
jgi:hypothetical protein